jgi:hypothetical protein
MSDGDATLYKFLDEALACPMSGMTWPAPAAGQPGGWVERAGPLDPEGLGFVTLRVDDLAPWCSAQLYRVEVDGARPADQASVVIAERVRLLEREVTWPQITRELGDWTLARVNALAPSHPRLAEYAGDVAGCIAHRMINGALFITAMAHAVAADLEANHPEARRAAFAQERALQSRFIADRLREKSRRAPTS